jgi:hypothetical protein
VPHCFPKARRPVSMPLWAARPPSRLPKPDRRQSLELLASSRDGCTEAILLADLTIPQSVESR